MPFAGGTLYPYHVEHVIAQQHRGQDSVEVAGIAAGKRGGFAFEFNIMIAATPMPAPKNLRQQTMQELEQAPDEDFVFVHEALLHARKLRLLDEISDDADGEQAAGKLDRLRELLAEVRAKLRTV